MVNNAARNFDQIISANYYATRKFLIAIYSFPSRSQGYITAFGYKLKFQVNSPVLRFVIKGFDCKGPKFINIIMEEKKTSSNDGACGHLKKGIDI